MRVRFTVAVCLSALLAAPLCAQKKGPGPAAKIIQPNPKQGRNQLDRIRKMTPAERRRLMERLPPERQKAIADRLERFQQLTPEEREQLRHQYELFERLPQERREAMRRLYQRFNSLSEERRPLLREEFQSLQALSVEERQARMNSDEFRNKYTAAEQQLLSDMSKILPENTPEKAPKP